MPIPGSMEPCRKCGRLVTIGRDAVPAWRLTGNKRSRGFYCQRCHDFLGGQAVELVKKERGKWKG